MSVSARRAWWKRRRWVAAIVLWLLVAHPLSIGPLSYSDTRGWIPGWDEGPAVIFAAPPGVIVFCDLPPREAFLAYLDWWDDLAHEHRLAD